MTRSNRTILCVLATAGLVTATFTRYLLSPVEDQLVLTRAELALVQGESEAAINLLQDVTKPQAGQLFDSGMLLYLRALNDRALQLRHDDPATSKALALQARDCLPNFEKAELPPEQERLRSDEDWQFEFVRTRSLHDETRSPIHSRRHSERIGVLVARHDASNASNRHALFEMMALRFRASKDSATTQWLSEHGERIPDLLPEILIRYAKLPVDYTRIDKRTTHFAYNDWGDSIDGHVVLELWSTELEDALAKTLEEREDLPVDVRAYLLECFIKFAGLPAARYAREHDQGRMKTELPSPEVFCKGQQRVLKTWRELRGLDRAKSLIRRIDLVMALWEDHERSPDNASPGLWAGSWQGQGFRALTGQPAHRSIEPAREWWKQNHSRPPSSWLAEELGLSRHATLQTRLEQFAKQPTNCAAREFMRLVFPASIDAPPGLVFNWGLSETSRSELWTRLAGR